MSSLLAGPTLPRRIIESTHPESALALTIALSAALLATPSAARAFPWLPDAPLEETYETPFGRWEIDAPAGLVRGRELGDAELHLESEPAVLMVLITERMRMLPVASRRVDAVREVCGDVATPITWSDDTRAWTFSCAEPVQLDPSRQWMQHFFWVPHVDGAVLQVSTAGDRDVPLRVVERMVASLRPRRVPLPRSTSMPPLRFSAPTGWVTSKRVQGVHTLVGFVDRLDPLGETHASVELWPSDGPRRDATYRPAGRGLHRWRELVRWGASAEEPRRPPAASTMQLDERSAPSVDEVRVLEAGYLCGGALLFEHLQLVGPPGATRDAAEHVARTLRFEGVHARECQWVEPRALAERPRHDWALLALALGLPAYALARRRRRWR